MVQMLFLVELYMPNMFYVDEHYIKKKTAETCVHVFLIEILIIYLNKMTMNHDSNPN